MNWLKKFKPRMIKYPEGETIVVKPVCAQRALRVWHTIAVRNAGNNKLTLRLLGV